VSGRRAPQARPAGAPGWLAGVSGPLAGMLGTSAARGLALAGASVALLAGAASLAGCGLGAGSAPSAVQLLVTRDFGAQTVREVHAPRIAGEETVMSLLIRNAPGVQTRYSGGFVQSIKGLSGGSEGGHPQDWFYYVNGIQAPKGAAATTVKAGDHIWWDLHDWSQTEDVPAVVGSFPEPFLNGIGGRRLPVLIECEAVGGYACRTIDERLRTLGIPAAIAAPNATPASQTLRVLVGTLKTLERDPAGEILSEGPRASGVYVRFPAGGGSLELLGPNGATARTLYSDSGLIAATRHEEEAPVWLVGGTDEAGVDLAARSFGEASLQRRFAVAVSGGSPSPIALPAATSPVP
jgi:hypothetical protein